MALKEQIQSDLKTAMKAKDMVRVSTLRLVISALKKKEIDSKKELTEPELIKLLGSLVKQRKDSIDAFVKGNRQDLADKEQQEIDILTGYLPEQMERAQVEAIVAQVIQEVGAAGPKDMGKVMPQVMAKTAGQADGKMVSEIVRAKLSGN